MIRMGRVTDNNLMKGIMQLLCQLIRQEVIVEVIAQYLEARQLVVPKKMIFR